MSTPSGRTVRQFNPFAGPGRSSARNGVEWTVENPDAGDWTVSVTPLRAETDVTVSIARTVLLGSGDGSVSAPNPVDALGYEQRSYSVSPLEYFEDYESYVVDGANSGDGKRGNGTTRRDAGVPGTLEGVGVQAIRNGALLNGNKPAVDNLVVTHAAGVDASYLERLSAYVDAGGTLVLTDRAVGLVAELDASPTTQLQPSDIHTFDIFSGFLGEKDLSHPLLEDVRPIQKELWKPAPMGYQISFAGATPFTGIDPEAFTEAGGDIAGLAFENPFDFFGPRTPWVGAGTLTRPDTGTVHVVGALLPPGEQTNLHPFGLREYTISFLGHTLLSNALGFTQKRYVDDELVMTFG